MGGEFTHQPKWDPRTVLTTAILRVSRRPWMMRASCWATCASWSRTCEACRTSELAGGQCGKRVLKIEALDEGSNGTHKETHTQTHKRRCSSESHKRKPGRLHQHKQLGANRARAWPRVGYLTFCCLEWREMKGTHRNICYYSSM